jgi:hypothetical protein
MPLKYFGDTEGMKSDLSLPFVRRC